MALGILWIGFRVGAPVEPPKKKARVAYKPAGSASNVQRKEQVHQVTWYGASAERAPDFASGHDSQRVHVGVWYILRAQRGSHIPTLRPRYIPYTYMDPLGL